MQYQIRREQINDPGIAGLIDSFIEKSNCGTIFHTTAWNRIVSKQFGSELFYFLAYSGQNIVGVLPCHFVRNSRYTWISYSPPRIFEVSYGGPVSIGPKAVEISKALAKAAVKIRTATFLSIFNSPLNTKWAHHSGRTKVISFETAYVDLEPSLEQIWTSSINGKRRNMIRKAQREGVEVKTGSVSDLDIYYSIVREMSQRTGLKMQPMSYYQAILEHFGSRDQARLYIAYHKGKALAGGIFLRYGAGCYYWVGATAHNVRNLGQGELIQWEVIQRAKEAGCKWYDLVGIERQRLPQIARFKLGFSRDTRIFHHVSAGTLAGRIIRRVEDCLARKSGRAKERYE